MNEKELVQKAKAGDFEAFSQLVDANKGRIYALALKMTSNQLDAEDIVQETMIKAIDNIDKFREEAAFGTWLYSIALNETRALLAKSKQTDLRPIEDYLPSGGHDDAHQNNRLSLFDWQDPHQQLENDELKKYIDLAVADLPYKYREAFVLRYVEELSIKKIAELTKESVASVKSRVLRGKLAVRTQLANVFEDNYGQKLS